MSSVTLKELSRVLVNSDLEYMYGAIENLILDHLPPYMKKFLGAMPPGGGWTSSRKMADKLKIEKNYAGTVLLALKELDLVERTYPGPGRKVSWRKKR